MIDRWFANPAARLWRREWRGHASRDFHASFAGYAPTPLREVPSLAAELGVGRVFVKDESSRLGLPAFKILGASWAIARLLSGEAAPTFEALRRHAPRDVTLVTATDGNHGRAVAHMAALLGVRARIFVPSVISNRAADAIAGEGAELERVDGDYDEAVNRAAEFVSAAPNARLVQDTAWPGYEEVPGWIVEGYRTILAEIDEQLTARGVAGPDLVSVPVGVGSLLQAVIAHSRSGSSAAPAILSVEPETAACVLASLHRGEPTSVETDATVMAGLNCGSISALAWPYVRDGLDAAVAVDDADALRAVADFGALDISSGPTGAASLAGARAALSGEDAGSRRQALGISPDSVVVLLSTEANPAMVR
jgi:diaminopropionate ammonia-lyase